MTTLTDGTCKCEKGEKGDKGTSVSVTVPFPTPVSARSCRSLRHKKIASERFGLIRRPKLVGLVGHPLDATFIVFADLK